MEDIFQLRELDNEIKKKISDYDKAKKKNNNNRVMDRKFSG